MRFGITLANRGVLLGLTTVKQLLALADAVETSPLLDALWVGDALFVNPRSMPSLCLLPWPAAPSPCFSAPPAWDRSHCAIHVCSPTNGPRSTCCRMAAPGCRCVRAAAAARGMPRRRQWTSRRLSAGAA